MDRRLTTALGVALLVLLAGCAGLPGTAADAGGANDLDRSIEVSAEGEATAEPDRATVRVAVEATGSDPGAVRSELATGDDELRTALYDWGIDEEDVRTERYDIRRTRESREAPDREAYRGEHVYAVEVDDVDAVGDVVDVAVDAGADGVERIEFGLSEERADELRDEALADAMGNAHDEADVLAENANLTVTGVYAVSTTNARTSPFTATGLRTEGDDAGGAAGTGIETGDVDVTVSVNVVFDAEAA